MSPALARPVPGAAGSAAAAVDAVRSLDDDPPLPPRSQALHALRHRAGVDVPATVELPEETAVALEFNGISGAVMLATPGDLEDFALGFALTEGIVVNAAQIFAIEPRVSARGVTLEIELAAEAYARMKNRRRVLAGRTGCGLCGIDSLDEAIRPVPTRFGRGRTVTSGALARAGRELGAAQALQRATGATHAAAWCAADGAVLLVREDVGRHNALDKLVGAITRAALDPEHGFALVTSRASIEMVQKAAMARMTMLVAVSAPTAAAARIAADCGLTLVGFARDDDFTVYAHGERIVL